MKNSNSTMSGTTKAIIGFVLFLIFVTLFSVYSFFSYSAKAVNMEQNIVDFDKEAKNVLSSCTGTIRAMSKIPKQYEESFINIIKADHQGRYGSDATQRVAKFMQERQLSYNDKFLVDLSNSFKSCEKSFETKQSLTNSAVSVYKRQLDNPWSGMFYRMHGFPKLKFSDYEMVLHTGVEEQFKTKVRKSFDAE